MKFIYYGFMGGVILGTVAFSPGNFGPIILTPESNQGPLLGIFVTGPLGFLVGIVAGCIYAAQKRFATAKLGATGVRILFSRRKSHEHCAR